MRIARRLIAVLFALVAATAVALAGTVLLAIHGHNLPLLRAATGAVGRAIAGQRTEAMALRAHLEPGAGLLRGEARLRVRADAGPRARIYFLLNDGLALHDAWQERADGSRSALAALRLGPLVVISLPAPLAEGDAAEVVLAYGGTPRDAGLTPGGAVFRSDDVVLAPGAFWYPADVQGAFEASLEVLLPAELTLAHNGTETGRTREGTSQRVRVTAARPVGGLALIAGRYRPHELQRDGHRYRALLPDDTTLDGARVLAQMATAREGLTAHYGPSGFPQSTLVVPRRVARAFNDGSGLFAVPPRYFRDGRYGYEVIAHELAHDWWGATVAERWLTPGSGGEWLVEGFAEFSAWRAVGEHFGTAALVAARRRGFYDPDRAGVLAAMSVVDNGLDPEARATIYGKGGTVTSMLAALLGEDTFDTAARAFLERYRYRAAGDAELQAVFSEVSQQDLEPFFAAWVRSRAALDLALEPEAGHAEVRNLRDAPPPAVALWHAGDGDETTRGEIAVGQQTPIGAARRVLLDPLAATADMIRSNNVLPRTDPPQHVATSARGEVLIVEGQPVAWEPATLRVVEAASGRTLHTWALERGLAAEPQWSADGTRVLALESGRDGRPTLLALNVGDGSRRALGHDTVFAADADGTLVGRGGTLLRLAPGGARQVLATHAGARVVAPLPAPRGGAVAYAVLRDADMALHLLEPETPEARVLFTWPAGALRWQWAPDGSRLYAVVGGDWDWQLWELPRAGEPRRLVHEAARLPDLAPAADGRIALVAQAVVDEPGDRAEIFLLDGAEFRRYDLDGRGAQSVAWLDPDTLLVVTRDPLDPAVPRATALQHLRLSDGTLWDETGR